MIKNKQKTKKHVWIYAHINVFVLWNQRLHVHVQAWLSRHHAWNSSYNPELQHLHLESKAIKKTLFSPLGRHANQGRTGIKRPKSISNTWSMCFMCTSDVLSFKAARDKMKTSETVMIKREVGSRQIFFVVVYSSVSRSSSGRGSFQ